jgi:hypothetical protein
VRNGAGVFRDSAELFIGQALVRAATQRLKGILIFYAVLSIFAIASLAFFYVLLYRWLASEVGDTIAAAILFGINLFMIAAMLMGRALMQSKAPASPVSPILELIKSQAGTLKSRAGGLKSEGGHFDAGLEIGSRIGGHVRKAAPRIALAAAVLGLVVGLRPQLLGLFRGRQTPPK